MVFNNVGDVIQFVAVIMGAVIGVLALLFPQIDTSITQKGLARKNQPLMQEDEIKRRLELLRILGLFMILWSVPLIIGFITT